MIIYCHILATAYYLQYNLFYNTHSQNRTRTWEQKFQPNKKYSQNMVTRLYQVGLFDRTHLEVKVQPVLAQFASLIT